MCFFVSSVSRTTHYTKRTAKGSRNEKNIALTAIEIAFISILPIQVGKTEYMQRKAIS